MSTVTATAFRGERTVVAKGEGLDQQSCKVFFIKKLGGVYINLTKAGRLKCMYMTPPH